MLHRTVRKLALCCKAHWIQTPLSLFYVQSSYNHPTGHTKRRRDRRRDSFNGPSCTGPESDHDGDTIRRRDIVCLDDGIVTTGRGHRVLEEEYVQTILKHINSDKQHHSAHNFYAGVTLLSARIMLKADRKHFYEVDARGRAVAGRLHSLPRPHTLVT